MKNCNQHVYARLVRTMLKKEKNHSDKNLKRIFYEFPGLYVTAKNLKILGFI